MKEQTPHREQAANHSFLSEGGTEALLVIKVGGHITGDPDALKAFLKDFAAIKGKKILVHGGGKIATRIAEQLGVASNYVNGRRVTDEAMVDVVAMVYGGLVNKKIVAGLQAFGCNAMGLTGADGNTIPARKRPPGKVDYGFVGDIEFPLESGVCQLLLRSGVTPVFAPLTHDGKGQILNTNADTIASALAVSLSAVYQVRLVYCFEKKGVLRDVNNENDVVHLIDRKVYARLAQEGALADGILPKLENAFDAIDRGVREVIIGQAADLLQNIGPGVTGTLIRS
jgi:acetylglutamate kinase